MDFFDMTVKDIIAHVIAFVLLCAIVSAVVFLLAFFVSIGFDVKCITPLQSFIVGTIVVIVRLIF